MILVTFIEVLIQNMDEINDNSIISKFTPLNNKTQISIRMLVSASKDILNSFL